METKIRKYEINLATLGNGVILFGLWTVIKYFVSFFVFDEGMQQINAVEGDKTYYIIVVVVAFTMDFLLRCYIGFSARGESNGKKKSIAYLIADGFLILVYFFGLGFEVFALFRSQDDLVALLITLIIDVTSVIILIELMINSIMLRRIRREAVSGSSISYSPQA